MAAFAGGGIHPGGICEDRFCHGGIKQGGNIYLSELRLPWRHLPVAYLPWLHFHSHSFFSRLQSRRGGTATGGRWAPLTAGQAWPMNCKFQITNPLNLFDFI